MNCSKCGRFMRRMSLEEQASYAIFYNNPAILDICEEWYECPSHCEIQFNVKVVVKDWRWIYGCVPKEEE